MSAHIGFRAYTHVPRPPADIVAHLAEYAPPDLSDAMYGSHTLDPAIGPLYPFSARIAGPAVTVCAPQGAFNIVKVAMEQTRPGDVLVVNACGITSFAVWGGNVSKGMRRRGVAGVIIDGAARDPDEAQAVGFPIFARAQATGTPLLDGPGEVNVAVACGGVVVRPGDVIVADANGIVAVPVEGIEWVLRQVADLKARHAAAQPVLEKGEVTGIQTIMQGLAQRGFAVDDRAGGS
jgi:regulator of RNase E activity RraA